MRLHAGTSLLLLASSLGSVARAAQPGAVEPVAAPIRDLIWGKLNFLHTTDTHGWLGGHLLEPQYSADWGDYVSFASHMRDEADERGVDLLVIDTGDRVEGNGLYDASSPKGLFTYDVFREQAVDLLCAGNHELYKADTADREHNTLVPYFKDNYVASNLDYLDEKTGVFAPHAQRYRKFKTKNQGLEVISFGFIFDFTMNAGNTAVQRVEETLKEDWFQEVLRDENPDLFIVAGHVGLRMPEFKAIFQAIRKAKWFTPIVFFGGHAHVRDAVRFDDNAYAIASGRYGETIGWVSVDGIKQKKSEGDRGPVPAGSPISFSRKYVDNNLFGLRYHSGRNESTFPTAEGKRVSKMIERARESLDLDYRFGCAPRDLWANRAEYPGDDSIYSWLEREVLPGSITRKDEKNGKPRLAIANTGALRFDILKGPFTKDSTYIVSPFTSKFRYVPDVPYEVAKKVIQMLNEAGHIFEGAGTLDARFMNVPEAMAAKSLDGRHDDARLELRHLSGQAPLDGGDEPELVDGYTTKDDLGTDGDDTEHLPLKFYSVPNCVQAEIDFPEKGDPDKVDLVFLDFIQQWVLLALKFSGGDYGGEDVKQWDDESLTYKIGSWIKENWGGDC